MVIFNLPFIKASILESIWSNGFIKIKSIEEVDNIGAYISKYMTKSAYREDRLIGQKCYFRSRNIYEPIETKVLAASAQGQQLMKAFMITKNQNGISIQYKQQKRTFCKLAKTRENRP